MEKPEYFEALIDYLANPFDDRTFQAFADSVGTTHTTLWRVRNAFETEIEHEVKIRRQSMFDAMRVQAYKSLAQKIKKDTNALKLFFQLSGDLIERTETVNKYESADEKRSRINALLKSLGLNVVPANEEKDLNINTISSNDTKKQ